jgi:hypothetical protein
LRAAFCSLIVFANGFASQASFAQWQPPVELKDVPVRQNCAKTRQTVGLSIQPSLLYPKGIIFMCPRRVQVIDRERPGASQFFLVHEYGHLALHTRSEELADQWAARQLSTSPAGRITLKQAARHFVDEADQFDPRYGTGLTRAFRILAFSGIPGWEWPEQVSAYQARFNLALKEGRVVILQIKPGYANSADLIFGLDHRQLGYLATGPGMEPIVIPPLADGTHEVELTDVWLYHQEQNGEQIEAARKLEASTTFACVAAKTLKLLLDFDGQDLRVRASAQ